MEIKIYKNWAFVDIAQQESDGSWGISTCALLKKKNGNWIFLAQGDPLDWGQYANTMPKDVLNFFNDWKGSHY